MWPRSRALRSSNRGAAHDDFAAVLQEELEELLEVQQPRLAVDQRDHVHAEAVLRAA